ncbi:NYN domain-containing protein [Hyphomicrobium sp. DY-1]|uniref:LabA-like NYN domain-containing protein n=1 Tax=Hyphomicrobium sp. DY-1 TaxID=3075650 RepID=UPI0039C48190
MFFDRNERMALFIDGPNLYASMRQLGFEIDYRRLLGVFRERARLIRAYYYTAIADDQEFSSVRPLVDWLDYNGFSVVTKPIRETMEHDGRRRLKGNMEVELAVDAMRIAAHIDHLIFFSGNGNLRYLVAALQERGRRVSVVSTLQTQPQMISDDLRRQADQFVDLTDLEGKIGRPQADPDRRKLASHQVAISVGSDVTGLAHPAFNRDISSKGDK